jgi:hypothetical protein
VSTVHSAGEFYSAFPERRINPFKPEVRKAIDGSAPGHIVGYASVFNKLSRKLGGFVEKVDNRAFTTSKAEGWQDVVCRYNHNDDFLLGTTRAGTCLLDFDNTGLLYDVVPPSFRSDIIELCERGDCQHSSFAFRVPEGGDDWGLSDFNYPLRTLLSVDLVDVAPVITPAYPDATAASRAMDGAITSLSMRFDAEPAEIRSLLAENMGVKLFKRTDRSPVTPALTLTNVTNGTYSTSTGTTATINMLTPVVSQEDTVDEARAKYDAAAMKKMAGSGEAMANSKGDPSYPIADEEDLHNAIHAVGRGHASHEAIRQHIISRAKAMGLSHMLPADWTSDPMADSSDEKNSAEETSEDRAAAATYDDLETCGDCGAGGQYGTYCTGCGKPMAQDGPMKGAYCSSCGGKTNGGKRSEHECNTEERTEAPDEETEVVEESEEDRAAKAAAKKAAPKSDDDDDDDDDDDAPKSKGKGKLPGNEKPTGKGDDQLPPWLQKKRSYLAELQEKRFSYGE